MATYYKWRRRTLKWNESSSSVSASTSPFEPPLMLWSGTKCYSANSKPAPSGGTYTLPNYHYFQEDEDNGWYWHDLQVIGSSEKTGTIYVAASSNAQVGGYSDRNKDEYTAIRGNWTKYTLSQGPGENAGYVYSTSSGAYPNGGASGGYYYDQRTTVTSPTAPSGLTYPEQILTRKAAVSWTAATSSTDYPVQSYEVSRSTDGGGSWTVVNAAVTGTSLTTEIPVGVTAIRFRVRAKDSNGQWGSYVTGTDAAVLLSPGLTVPELAMQGQSVAVSWSELEGADSYTLQRKADTDADWVQVYTGAGLTFTETAGAWTSVQYRVQAVFSGVPGGWAVSEAIPVVSAAALVISGQDGDLGTIVNDVPYSVSSDGGSPLLVTVRVNGGLADSLTAENGKTNWIPVVDLPTGHGKIEIAASTETGSGLVNVVRSWTYTKTATTFGDAGGVAELSLNGQTVWPKTIPEAVRTPRFWGGNLGTALSLLKNAALYSRTRQPKYTEVKVDLSKVKEGDVVNLPEGGFMVPFYVAKLDYEEELNGAGRTLLVRKEVYDFRQWHSALITAYASSDIDVWMNGDYKNMLDPSIREAMGTTKIRYTPGNGDLTVSTLERAVFPLSPTELGISNDGTNVEGSALPIANALKIATYNGAANSQWTRSPNRKTNASEYVFILDTKGNLTNAYSTNTNGSRPAFTLPADFSTGTYLVGPNGAIKAEQEYTQGGDFSDIWGKTIPVPKIAVGSYVGTGTHGKDNPNTLTFPFEPKLVVISIAATPNKVTSGYCSVFLYGCNAPVFSVAGGEMSTSSQYDLLTTWEKNRLSYCRAGGPGGAEVQLNAAGKQYNYMAIG